MSWVIIVVICVIWVIIESFRSKGSEREQTSNNGEYSYNELMEKKQKLLDGLGERNTSIGLLERNKDIIDHYLINLRGPGYRDYYYIDNCVRDCINDIGTIEGYFDVIPGSKYLSNWKQSVNDPIYKKLSDDLGSMFAQRLNTIKESFELESKYLLESKEFKLNELKKVKASIDTFANAIKKKESRISETLNQINLGDDIMYHTLFVESKKVVAINENNIEKILIKVFDMFSKEKSDILIEEETVYGDEEDDIGIDEELIGEVIPNIIKNPLEGFKIDEDSSRIEKIDAILESLYFSKTQEFITFNYPKNENLFLENEQSMLKEIYEKIDTVHRGINKRHLQLYRAAKEKIKQLLEDYNRTIAEVLISYNNGEKRGIELRNMKMISESQFDNIFEKEFELEYNGENAVLVVEYVFPDLNHFPQIKEYKKLSNGDVRECLYSNKSRLELYDEYLTSVCIRLMYEVFKNDVVNAIDCISFNGRVRTINKASGNDETICIMSIQTLKKEFKDMRLYNIDPKVSFKSLKGISASKLSSLTPIKPVLTINKNDRRFVEGYNVIDDIDNTTNLASMDWQDFENLIRELFGKIFSVNGGEVKVTQASRDGGVDAIAFDPDPIKGGKTIIQAKRYTNVVGVSAVRDLYGSVHNEGAIKGILVTTSDYGSDAYKFASNKPITLISGQELLHLLEEHGYHASINIKEAKRKLHGK